ncbi:MAG: inorganic phosphate transporter [Veillonellales bacterium]
MPDLLIIFVVLLSLGFDYINGFHDTANAIATSVSTRALTPKVAVVLAAGLNFAGAMYSTGVAKTIGSDLVKSAQMVNEPIIIAAMIGAICWNVLTWWLGIPSSSSHALVGGVVGAVLVSRGVEALKIEGILGIVASLIVSPIIAMGTGFVIMTLLFLIFGRMAPSKINSKFKRLQILSAAMMAFSHGSNDAQKAMGIITLTLVSSGYLTSLEVPIWVKMAAAISMGMGTAAGGWRIIRTMGSKIFKLEPISGFAADLNSSLVIFGATLLRMPVSTTHVVSGSIMGVGTAKRVRAVRWGVAQQMLIAWIFTIPSTALVSGTVYKIIAMLFL